MICTDKTGTLTQNRMQVADAVFFGSPSDGLIDAGIAVNSTAELDRTEILQKERCCCGSNPAA